MPRERNAELDIRTRRKMFAILRILRESAGPIGSEKIAEALRISGKDLNERTIRNYLAQADELGWTENLGRRGRQITQIGREELESALVVDKVGFVSGRVDTLTYKMDFDLESKRGKVILNISTLSPKDVRVAITELAKIYDANLGMGRYVAIAAPGEKIGDFQVPEDCFAIGTICSVSINGIFLNANIATTSCFGGLLQLEKGLPKRFTEIIKYDGTSLDPLEIFIRGHMTTVCEAARDGSGMLGASFREVPSVALNEVHRLNKCSEKLGIGSILAIGKPGQPLLDIQVPQERTGLIVAGGLNPIAAIVEKGITVHSTAMSTFCDFKDLIDYKEIDKEIMKLRLEAYY